ncbi:MAG: hypothetical protein E6J91_11545, partial [Deltaproteobacteria bacterium]
MIYLLRRGSCRLALATAVLAAAACGKSTRDQTTAEPRSEPGAPGAPVPASVEHPPARPPEKAASRGPEHAVYSLVDNRLSA